MPQLFVGEHGYLSGWGAGAIFVPFNGGFAKGSCDGAPSVAKGFQLTD